MLHEGHEGESNGTALTPGRVRFATAEERDAACRDLAQAGMLVVELEGIGPSARGRLGEVLGEAIDRQLEARGAPGSGIAHGMENGAGMDAALSDQLFRSRRAGGAGLAIVFGPLRAATGGANALEPEDCGTLRFLVESTRERPVVVLFDEVDRQIGAYGDPVPLDRLLLGFGAGLGVSTGSGEPDPSDAPSAPPEAAPPAAVEAADEPAGLDEPHLARHTAGASVVVREEPWRAWTLQLATARGPQPLAALERLFSECYMPLVNAIASGLDDPRARAAQDEFRFTFSRGYTEAFPTFAATTKRPRMVLDVHDVAARIARLHGARSARVLLVDSMRWDLSRQIEERVVAHLGARSALTDEMILWSALPTTTIRQLETIARGVEALRAPAELDLVAADAEAARGRTSEYVRRMRVGPREIYKLDVVQARLLATRGAVLETLPHVVDVAAEIIARHAETLPPRTLLFVFGDHGFVVDKHGAYGHSGATPEEVLVGAFALLLGDVH
jgi:hypothetical protein